MRKVLAEKIKRGHESIYTIAAECNLREAARKMSYMKVGCVLIESPVTYDDEFCGILSERDILKAIGEGVDCDNTTIMEIGSQKVIVASPDDEVDYVVSLMTKKHIRHIPLVEDGIVCGLISVRDIIHAIDEEKDLKISMLSDYAAGTHINDVY